MTSGNEFVPVGKPIESSRQLELNMRDQHNLIAEMQLTMSELGEQPTIKPLFKSVKLGRIGLLDINGERKGRDQLWVQYSETSDGRKNARIDFSEEGHLNRLTLSQTTGKWDLSQDTLTESTKSFESEDVVNILRRKIRRPEALESLLDVAGFDAMTIPRLLASYLERSARRREKKVIYSSSDIVANLQQTGADTDVSYVSAARTDLSLFTLNGRHVHSLRIGAPYSIGNTTIRKEYVYSAETSDKYFYRSLGLVKASSEDGYSEAQLDPYTRFDQSVNDPLFSLYHGLTALRSHHGLDTKNAA